MDFHSRSPWARRLLAAAALALVVVPIAAAATRPRANTPALPGRIVYSRAQESVWDLFLADPNGAAEDRLTNTQDVDINRSAAGEDKPRWSPDGREISFTTYDRTGERSTIFRVPYGGGTPTPVVENDTGFGDAAWQRPVGRCLVYSGQRPGAQPRASDLFLACPGEAARGLVSTAELDEGGPDWKPDGSELVFEARDTGQDNLENKQWDLWIAQADGTDRRKLVDEPNTSERHARWSPDGRHVAFVSYAYKVGLGRGVLKTLDLATGEVTAHVDGVAGPMAWSPDGRLILFYNTWDQGPLPQALAEPAQPAQVKGLYMLDVETHEISRLLPPAGGEQATDLSFEWGYAPDWSAGTPTPTPTATNTPTATATPTVTPTDEPTPTTGPTAPPNVYLPIARKDEALGPVR
jgi:dipeptidyl aminopeptidase/acylaminoacyl peptidase